MPIGVYMYCMECAAEEPDEAEVTPSGADTFVQELPTHEQVIEGLKNIILRAPPPDGPVVPGPARSSPTACTSMRDTCRCSRLANHKNQHRCGCGQEWS